MPLGRSAAPSRGPRCPRRRARCRLGAGGLEPQHGAGTQPGGRPSRPVTVRWWQRDPAYEDDEHMR